MRSIRLIAILGLAAYITGGATVYAAVTNEFTCTDDDWSDPNCWDQGHTPTSDEDVLIPRDKICNMDVDAEINSFSIGTLDHQGGTLHIQAGKTLTIKDDSTMWGPIYLEGSGSTLRISPPGNSTLVIGGWDGAGGWIRGDHADAVITVDSGDTLSAQEITIYGELQIKGSGTFDNQGIVVSDVMTHAPTTLEVATTGGLTDTAGTGTDRWLVYDRYARLHFTSDLPSGISLAGDFAIYTGEIQVDQAITTSGKLVMQAGLVDVNENLTMGSASNHMNMTLGKIEVAAGKKFEHK